MYNLMGITLMGITLVSFFFLVSRKNFYFRNTRQIFTLTQTHELSHITHVFFPFYVLAI